MDFCIGCYQIISEIGSKIPDDIVPFIQKKRKSNLIERDVDILEKLRNNYLGLEKKVKTTFSSIKEKDNRKIKEKDPLKIRQQN
ncbi:hypothetical protein M0811_05429 [Anaeramoeba ignava]|uniref:Uncharacterized protein n=1 Tax=Anaeramoeba ignava TaxID=1746090 RepID=A0A9Q0LQX4_ANAIG|nr:hypothetical protein M0811_05429 [Anaeramoeba ignava]